MATARRVASLFLVALGLGGALLPADAIPQGYHHARHRRAHGCPTCPGDCPEKLAEPVSIALYAPAEAAQPAQSQPSYGPHPTAAPYAAPATKTQARQYPTPAVRPYQPVAPPAQLYHRAATAYIPYAYDEPTDNYMDSYGQPGYDWPYGSCRCGRSLRAGDDYAAYGKNGRRSSDADKPDEPPAKPLPFADESGPPANLYRNYRPYVRDADGYEDDSEEEARRASPGRDRLFVVYRADAFDDSPSPSDSELKSVVRQAMENFARDARKPHRYHYASQDKRHDVAQPIHFEPLTAKAEPPTQRSGLPPGPLMSVGETYVTEKGDDALNPGLDQSKWTAVPSHVDVELRSPRSEMAGEEIEAAVSVASESPSAKLATVPTTIRKTVDATDARGKLKPESIKLASTADVEKKNEKMAEMIEDMPTPTSVTESTNFEKPARIVVTPAPT